MRQMEAKTWCVEWFGSEGDFLAGGKRHPFPWPRLSGLETLYAIGALEQRPGEVSIFDSVPFVSEVWNPTETIDSNRLPSRISGLHDRRTLAQSLDLEVRQQRGRIGSGAIATSRDRGNQCRSHCSGGRSLLL